MHRFISGLPAARARVVVVVLAGVLAACGGGSGGGEGGDSAPARQFLSVGTAPPGGAFFVVGSALAEVVNETATGLGYSVTAEATSGSQENIRRLASGELDFALSNAAITYFAVRGSEGWDRAYQVRSVMTLAPNVALFVTQAASGINTIDDLRGRRVSVGSGGSRVRVLRPSAARGARSDLRRLLPPQRDAAGCRRHADRRLGGCDVPRRRGADRFDHAGGGVDGVTFIPYGNDEKARLVDEYVFFRPATIPPETYRGQSEPFEGLDVGSMHFITSTDAPEDLVYNVTKLLYENRELVVEKHAAGRAINPANVVRDTGTAFHPGAIRFYQEAGVWPPQAAP